MKPLTTLPARDGFRMPAEWEPQQQIWMLWPERPDNWRNGGKPAQQAFAAVARAIAGFEPVTVGVSQAQYENACYRLADPAIRVVELSSNDAWMRDVGPTFVTNGRELRAIDWTFNAWGGFDGGLYWPWQRDDQVARKILEIEGSKKVKNAYQVSTTALLRGQSPFDVTFFVGEKSGRFYNMYVEGVNMLLTERTEVGALLDANGGNIDAMIAALRSAS